MVATSPSITVTSFVNKFCPSPLKNGEKKDQKKFPSIKILLMGVIKMRNKKCIRKWTPVVTFGMAHIPFSIVHKISLLIRDRSRGKIQLNLESIALKICDANISASSILY